MTIRQWFTRGVRSSVCIETAALRVAEAAVQRLLGGDFPGFPTRVRPAFARGYARAYATQAVRRSLGPARPQYDHDELQVIQQRAIFHSTEQLLNRRATAAAASSYRRAA